MTTGERLRTTIPTLALTVTHAAAALDMSEDHFREHVAPYVRWVRRGRKRVVSVAELKRWIVENEEPVL
jgi:hypothetical protein